ncbi:MAG: sulfatase-like hydrolase/transferase [Planctomycetota bacterium]|nr:sulfatase-like hydrolase/transferase [Planctomycetota bacterium]
MSRPNILFICTDQQSSHMMSCTGHPHVNTPAMDSLAARGVRFNRAYCTNPVCSPSRFSLITGRYPSEIGQRENGVPHLEALPDHILSHSLGWLMREAGYETVYGGKEHLPKSKAVDHGFDYICRDERMGLAQACADYLRQDHDKPFLMMAHFINPHDICYMAIRAFAETEQEKRLTNRGKQELEALDNALKLPNGISEEEFFEKCCPPLPHNFEPQEDEPDAIRTFLAQRPFKQKAREQWTEKDWRMHRWAYRNLTEMVDTEIGVVLDALKETGLEDNTVVVFTSDHGDHDGSHRMEHKTAPYEEAARIPLIVARPGFTPAGTVNSTHLISNGLDFVPTCCDYAGIDPPADLLGRSFRQLAEGTEPDDWRESLLIESEIGRAVVTQTHKYILYDMGESREQLMDLIADPYETRNAAKDEENRKVLEAHRKLLQ